MTTRTLLVIRLPVLPMPEMSVNAFLGNGTHWERAKARGAQVQAWLWELKIAGAHLVPPLRPEDYPVSVTVIVRGTGYRTDPSNWVGHLGIKVLLDCLTEPKGRKTYGLGVIKDDSARYVRAFRVDWEPDGEPETEVRIGGGA